MHVTSQHKAVTMGGLVVAAGLAFGACTETEYREVIVEVEKPLYEELPAAAAGFVGYGTESNVEASFSVCGNCHVGTQNAWQLTAHADAWDGLQSSDHAAEYCENCHTVSELGNAATGDVGWTGTADARFYDVQCESCHGGGQAHVDDPDNAPIPLASAAVGHGTEGNCGDCHEDTHHPFAEEWSNSPHNGEGPGFARASTRESCQPCHAAQGVLPAWGENAEYVEKDGDPLPQVCVVCHDPHAKNNDAQLRFPADVPSIEVHLCSKCHNRRAIPSGTSSHGLHPHSPESAILDGSAGYFFPGGGIDVGQIRATHGSEANPDWCTSCHVYGYTVTDPSGGFLWTATGHLFRPIPCVDAQGIPQGFEVQCELTTQARSFAACTGSGCHGSEDAALSALTAASLRIERLAHEVNDVLAIVDPNGEDPGGEIEATDGKITVAEGAFFNMELAEFGGEEYGTDNVLGSATHNPFLIEAHLLNSLDALEAEYGVTPNIGFDVRARLEEMVRMYGR